MVRPVGRVYGGANFRGREAVVVLYNVYNTMQCTCTDGKIFGCKSNHGNECNRKFGKRIPQFRHRPDRLFVLQEPGHVEDVRGYDYGF